MVILVHVTVCMVMCVYMCCVMGVCVERLMVCGYVLCAKLSTVHILSRLMKVQNITRKPAGFREGQVLQMSSTTTM